VLRCTGFLSCFLFVKTPVGLSSSGMIYSPSNVREGIPLKMDQAYRRNPFLIFLVNSPVIYIIKYSHTQSSININRLINVRNIRWVGHVACIEAMRNAYNILVRKPERESPLGRLRLMWEYNIRMDLREIGSEVMDWIHLAHDRDQWRSPVNTVMNLRIP
jgi:hypothetical protein